MGVRRDFVALTFGSCGEVTGWNAQWFEEAGHDLVAAGSLAQTHNAAEKIARARAWTTRSALVRMGQSQHVPGPLAKAELEFPLGTKLAGVMKPA